MSLTPESVRQDIKCGNGAISKGEKCTKGPGVPGRGKTKDSKLGWGERAAILAGAGLSVGLFARGARRMHKAQGIAKSVENRSYKSEKDLDEIYQTGNKALNKAEQGFNDIGWAPAGIAVSGATMAAIGEKKKDKKLRNTGLGVTALGTYLTVGGRRAVGESKSRFQEVREEFKSEVNRHKQAARAGEDAARQARAREAAGKGGWNNTKSTPNKAVVDPYKDLGVTESATDAEIKKAWLKLMRKHHPDAGGNPETAKQVNAAYQELMRRRRSDSVDSIWAAGMEINWDEIELEFY